MEWDYSEQSDPNVIFGEIQEKIERYAYPFFDRYSNMDNVCLCWQGFLQSICHTSA